MNLSEAKTREYETTTINPFSPLVASDVDLDGHQEIFFSTDNSTLVEYSTKDNEYRFLLSSLEDARFIHAPQLVDIDFDSRPELIIYDVENTCMLCLNLTNEELVWTIQGDAHMDSQPKILIDRESKTCRVLVSLGPGRVGLYDADGNNLWIKSFPGTEMPPSLAIADIDYDEELEFVAMWTGDDLHDSRMGIDICDLRTSATEVNWTGIYTGNSWVPPLCYDLVADEPGMEVVFCTPYAGVRALSSASGKVLWQRGMAYNNIDSIEVVETRSANLLVAISGDLLVAMNGSDGSVVCTRTYRAFAMKHDLSFTGHFNLDGGNMAILYSYPYYVTVLDPLTNATIWQYELPDGTRRVRAVCVKGDGDEAFSLHLFFWHMDLKNTKHIKLWEGSEEAISIRADPLSFIAHPGVGTRISGITVEGVGDGPESMMVRLFSQGEDAVVTYHNGVFHESVFTPGLLIEELSLQLSDGAILISYQLTVPWPHGTRARLSMELLVRTLESTMAFRTFEDYILVEEGVELVGCPYAEGTGGERYQEGEWVLDGVHLTIRGVFLYFNGTSASPLSADVIITLEMVSVPPISGRLDATGEVLANLTVALGFGGPMNLTLWLEMRWSLQVVSLIFNLKVDSETPSILEVYPESGLWYGEDWVTVGCQATDGGGSGVTVFELRYGPHDDQMGDWTRVMDRTVEGLVEEITSQLQLYDGSWDVVWRVFDGVGHGPVESDVVTLNIDTKDIEFSSFSPTDWCNRTLVDVSIALRDINGSGIDLTTVSYSVSTSGLFSFSEWVLLDLMGEREELVLDLAVEFLEGVDNHIRFRASDVAGNERTSDAHRVLVDITPPYFLNPLPDDEMVLYNQTFSECSISVIDDLSGVDRESIMYQYSTGPLEWSDWYIARALNGGEEFVGEVRRNEDGPTSVRWRANDLARGEYAVSDVYFINLNRPPEIVELLPGRWHIMRGRGDVFFSVNVSDPEGDQVAIEWYLEDKLVSGNASFEWLFEEGEYQVILYLDDQNGNRLIVNVTVNAKEEPDISGGSDYLMVLILVAAIFGIAVLLLHKKRRVKD